MKFFFWKPEALRDANLRQGSRYRWTGCPYHTVEKVGLTVNKIPDSERDSRPPQNRTFCY